jgi:hypothetical protein
MFSQLAHWTVPSKQNRQDFDDRGRVDGVSADKYRVLAEKHDASRIPRSFLTF